MKLLRNLIIGALFITLCSFMAKDGQGPADAYKYPVTGAKLSELALDKDGDHRLEACQVPADVLAKMSTAGIVETSITHPMYDYIDFQNNFQLYFDWLSGNANVYPELYKRPDAGKILFARIKSTDLGDISKYELNSKEYFDFYNTTKKSYFLIAQPQVLATLDYQSRVGLLDDISAKMEDVKGKYSKIYFGANFIYYFPYASVKLMELENYPPYVKEASTNSALTNYAKTGVMQTKEVLDDVIRLTKNFSNSKKQ